MNVHELLNSASMYRMGYTLLHSLWQASAAAGALWLLLAITKRRAPQLRYLFAIIALLAVIAAGATTFCLTAPPVGSDAVRRFFAVSPECPDGHTTNARANDRSGAARRSPAPDELATNTPDNENTSGAVLSSSEARPDRLTLMRHASEDGSMAPVAPAAPWRERIAGAINPYLPWLVGAWWVGVAAMTLLRAGGWLAAMRLRVVGTCVIVGEIRQQAARLAALMGLRRPVRVLQSLVAQTPMVIGHLRPVMLLPLSAVTGLSAAQLEAILAHELAHVRRHDYLANLLQTVAETLLFYHPAVWWISRQLRAERERCCDDIAVALCGDRVTYAEALAALEESRGEERRAKSETAKKEEPTIPGGTPKSSWGCLDAREEHPQEDLGVPPGEFAVPPRDLVSPTKPNAKRRARLGKRGVHGVAARGDDGRDLVDRVRRVLGLPEPRPTRARVLTGIGALTSLLIVGLIIYGCAVNGGNSAPADRSATQPASSTSSGQAVRQGSPPATSPAVKTAAQWRRELLDASVASADLASHASKADPEFIKQQGYKKPDDEFFFGAVCPTNKQVSGYMAARPWIVAYAQRLDHDGSRYFEQERGYSYDAPSAVPSPTRDDAGALRELLGDKDPAVRALAVEALAAIDDPEDVPRIGALLGDQGKAPPSLEWLYNMSSYGVLGEWAAVRGAKPAPDRVDGWRFWQQMTVADYAARSLHMMTDRGFTPETFARWWKVNSDYRQCLWYWQIRLQTEMDTHDRTVRNRSPKVWAQEVVFLDRERARLRKEFADRLRELPPETEAKVRLLALHYQAGGAEITGPENRFFDGPLKLRISHARVIELVSGKDLWPDVDWKDQFRPKGSTTPGGYSYERENSIRRWRLTVAHSGADYRNAMLERIGLSAQTLLDPKDAPALRTAIGGLVKEQYWRSPAALMIGLSRLLPPAGKDFDDPNTREGLLRQEVKTRKHVLDVFARGYLLAEMVQTCLETQWPFIEEQFWATERSQGFPDERQQIISALTTDPVTPLKREHLFGLLLDKRFDALWWKVDRKTDWSEDRYFGAVNRALFKLAGGKYPLEGIEVKTPADVAEIRRRIEKLAATQPATAPAGTDWVKTAARPEDRAGMYAAMEKVQGGAKFSKADSIQRGMPLSSKGMNVTLDQWFDVLLIKDFVLSEGVERTLLFRSRQVDDNDRMWIDRIERKGNHFTVHMQRATWAGDYAKNITYFSVFAVNIGKLPAGEYTYEWIIEPLVFTELGKDDWPKDAKPDPKAKPVSMGKQSFAISRSKATAPTTQPANLQEAAERLRKEVGGQWEVGETKLGSRPIGLVAKGRVPLPGGRPDQWVPIYVFPCAWSASDGRTIAEYFWSYAAPFDVIGTSDRFTVVAWLGPDQPLAQKVVQTLGLGPPAFSIDAIRQAERFRHDAESFVLTLSGPPAKDRQTTLKLWVTPQNEPPPGEGQLRVKISKEQAQAVLDRLVEIGLVDDALRRRGIDPPLLEPHQCLLTLSAGKEEFSADLGMRMPALERLDALRGVLDGAAAEAMDKFMAPLAEHRKEWQAQAATQPAEVRAASIAVRKEILELVEGDARRRVVAARQLEMLAPQAQAAIPYLIALLPDDSRADAGRLRVGMEASNALVHIGKPALPALVEALEARDALGRERAVQALGRLRDELSVRALTEALKDSSPSVRQWAANGLGELGDGTAVPALIERLDDPEFWVCSTAANALAKLKDDRAVEPLLAALKRAVKAKLGAADLARALAQFSDPRKRALAILKEGAASDDTRTRALALSAMGDLGDADAVALLTAALKDPQPLVRACAASALGRIKKNVPLEPLLAALADADSKVRYQAVSALGRIGDERAVGPVLKLFTDKDPQVRVQAVSVVGWLWSALLRSSPVGGLSEADVQAKAALLDRMVKLGAVAAMIERLDDPGRDIPHYAAQALSFISGQNLGKDAAKWRQWFQATFPSATQPASSTSSGQAVRQGSPQAAPATKPG